MEKCLNERLINPIRVQMINGVYQGMRGWADGQPNEYGIVRFCADGGKPFQFNTFPNFMVELKG